MLYARVKDGEVLEYQDFSGAISNQSSLAANKPKLLPVEVEGENYDAVTQSRSETYEVVIESTRVIHRYTVAAKNEDQIADMIQRKNVLIDREFQRLWQIPITFNVSDVEYQWDADDDAVTNVMGVLMAYQVAEAGGSPLPDPRTWVPHGAMEAVTISHAEIAGLGLSIAARKDFLFYKKKAKQAAVLALTDPTEIDQYDITNGWA